MLIVFDLDGTLANCDARDNAFIYDPVLGAPHARDRETIDWLAHANACHSDLPHQPVIATMRALQRAGHDVRIWTARLDCSRFATLQWLWDHGINVSQSKLTMKRSGDTRPDHVVKAEWMTQQGKPDIVFEDRNSVVAMWRALGVVCFHVAEGDF